jgi:hypothetical protein
MVLLYLLTFLKPREREMVKINEGSQAMPARTSDAEHRLYNIYMFSPYLKENTTLHHYKDQLVNVVQGNNRCLQ